MKFHQFFQKFNKINFNLYFINAGTIHVNNKYNGIQYFILGIADKDKEESEANSIQTKKSPLYNPNL